MSRGRRKPKLRDYSVLSLTPEQRIELRDVFSSFKNYPMVTAILGCIFVEAELEALLRRRFKGDQDTWEKLTDEHGPIGSFAQKITVGHALRIYDTKCEHDLNAIRRIRNAFAHSKKILKFSDPLIIDEIKRAHCLRPLYKKALSENSPAAAMENFSRTCYVIVCLILATRFLTKYNRLNQASGGRRLKKLSPLAYVLSQANQEAIPQSVPAHQSGGPIPLARGGFFEALLQEPPKSNDKTGT